MKLFYAPQSPFARKARAAAIELGLAERIELEYAEVIPSLPNKAFGQAHNPLRRIPALITDAGETLYDSTVICEYLDTLAGGSLIPREAPRRWRVLTQHALANGMCESIVLIRYETSVRPAELRWSTWTDDHWDKIYSGIDWFERNDAVLREPLDLAHLALGCALGYIDFRWPERQWKQRAPAVAAWFARLEQRPSFAMTKPQPAPGSDADPSHEGP